MFLHSKMFLMILIWVVYLFLYTVFVFSQILFLPLQDHLWLFMICTWFGDAFRDSLAHIKLWLKIIINLNLDENSSQMWWKSKAKCQDCMRNIFYIKILGGTAIPDSIKDLPLLLLHMPIPNFENLLPWHWISNFSAIFL